ncbi:MAG: choice-of-anchor D domain-containing protein [Chloroflexota bacterium]
MNLHTNDAQAKKTDSTKQGTPCFKDQPHAHTRLARLHHFHSQMTLAARYPSAWHAIQSIWSRVKATFVMPIYWQQRVNRVARTAIGGIAGASLLCSSLLPAAPSLQAATISVNTNTIGGPGCDLVEAIDAANNDSTGGGADCVQGSGDDTIIFDTSPDTIQLITTNNTTSGNNGLPVITSNITINGGSGITITRNSAAQFRIMYVNGGDITLDNVTIHNGSLTGTGNPSGNGAGIMGNNNAVINLTNSRIISNASTQNRGGGLYTRGSSDVTLTNSEVRENYARQHGGGLQVRYTSTLNLISSRIVSNTGQNNGGGGIFARQSMVNITDTLVSENYSSVRGGGIYVQNSSAVTITNSDISTNTSKEHGGGIMTRFNGDTLVRVVDSVVRNNYANGQGGGISGDDHSPVYINGSRFISNTAKTQGGGIHVVDYSPVTITNSYIISNSANDPGGGLHAYKYSTATVASTVVAFNRSETSDGGGLYKRSDTLTVSDSQIYGNYSKVGGGGLISRGSNTTITNSSIHENYSDSHGGGIFARSGGSVVINNSDIISNIAKNEGGGFHSESVSFILTDTDVISNTSVLGQGGGILIKTNAQLTATNSTIRINKAKSQGGGLWVNSSNANIINSTIQSNTVTNGRGGGLFANSSSVITLTGSSFLGNSASNDGGGIYTQSSPVRAEGSTIAQNISYNSGGGLAMVNTSLYITNSRILTNAASNRGGAFYYSGSGSGPLTIAQSCIVYNSYYAVYNNHAGVTIDAQSNWWGRSDGASGVPGGYGDGVNSNVDTANHLTAAILGCATLIPEIAISGNTIDIAHNDTTPSAADDTDFGDLLVGSSTLTKTFTIANLGFNDLDLTLPITLSGAGAAHFGVTADPNTNISAGASTTFQVAFTPTVLGTHNATLEVANSDSDENPFTFAIQGTGTLPEIALGGNGQAIVDGSTTPTTTNATDFGLSPINTPVVNTFTISNVGTSALNLTLPIAFSGPGAAQFAVTTDPSSTVAAGATTTFQVTFTPTAQTVYTATLSITNDDGDENPFDFILKGGGTGAEIGLFGNGQSIVDGSTTVSTVNATDFGASRIGTPVTNTFTVSNTGVGPLNLILPFTITGPNAADFVVTTNPNSAIAASSSTPFDITFTPSALGIHSATIELANDDLDEGIYDFVVQGTGTDPEIDVRGNGQAIADGSMIPSTGNHTDFGTTLIGTPIVKTFTVSNTGTYPLALTLPVAITGAFANNFSVTTAPANTVATNTATTFQVTFIPTIPGNHTATLALTNDDSDETPYDFAIQGGGYLADPMITIDDPTFGETGGLMQFVVSLSAIHTGTVSVDYATALSNPASASAGTDFVAISGTATISAGLTSTIIDVTLLDDALVEGHETFGLTLSNPVNGVIADATGVGTIIDNETDTSLSVDDVSASETDGELVFTVRLANAFPQDITVNYTTENGSAVAGTNYTAQSGTLTIPAGATSANIPIPIANLSIAQGNRSFNLLLSNASGATIADGQAIGTIIDNPANPTPNAVDDPDDENTIIVAGVTEIDVLANDTDVDENGEDSSAGLNVVGVGTSSNGVGTPAVKGDGSAVIYTPNEDVSGADDFIYVVSDGILTDTATVNIVILVNDAPGDCNSDGGLGGGDFAAILLEIFDGDDGLPWYESANHGFPGSARGCDANGDQTLNIADLQCSINSFFGNNACTAGAVTGRDMGGRPQLRTSMNIEATRAEREAETTFEALSLAVGGQQAASVGEVIDLPIILNSGEHTVTSAAFSIHYDTAQLHFDERDDDGDGMDDAVTFHTPANMLLHANHHRDEGRIDIAIVSLSVPPAPVVDALEGQPPLVTLQLQVAAYASNGLTAVRIQNASLGNEQGAELTPVTVHHATIDIDGGINKLFLPLLVR